VISATFFLLERFAVKGIQFYPNFPVEFGREKNFSLRRAAIIQVETTPTAPSTADLSWGLLTRAGMIAVL